MIPFKWGHVSSIDMVVGFLKSNIENGLLNA